ncbi:MAG: CDP-alcohol phosphatidyltransferase family protein [Erythrobacter sp.]|uniref:CDP-alcohol phosphatidyltransferase family protein n=1 Tax=Erythrobacter sp. TaxID=1042 RepID=UPI00261A6FB9|nr:CDP-alcohol phosphatidyltransferase family protein [Erythrobacter sp.]MDJ0979110.1 CDP-alcohol phosphatidyltransferase family protein [Erythrobacter sp.]
MVNPIIVFDSEETAAALVAGLPLAARVCRRLADTKILKNRYCVVLAAPGGWRRPERIEAEIRRLVTSISVQFETLESTQQGPSDRPAIDAVSLLTGVQPPLARPLGIVAREAAARESQATRAALDTASRRIVAQTGKPTDGFVSRFLNRPVSKFLSYHALKVAWVRPIHATLSAGLLGLAMAVCLFLGGATGLALGAILFQAASIVDGVDGEIARATQRSSKMGATLDTLTDALTNFAFIAGVSANLWLSGDVVAGQMGVGAMILLAFGLTLLGLRSVRAGGGLSFDALKHDDRTASSPVLSALAKIASRDVYALVLAALVLVGLAPAALALFAGAVCVWFAVALIMLTTSAKPR